MTEPRRDRKREVLWYSDEDPIPHLNETTEQYRERVMLVREKSGDKSK